MQPLIIPKLNYYLITFSDLLRHGKEILKMFFFRSEEYESFRNNYGALTLLRTSHPEEVCSKKAIKYYTTLCELYDLGFLVVSDPGLLYGRLEDTDMGYRYIPQIDFLMERDPRSERFLHYIRSMPMLDVYVRNSTDGLADSDIEASTFYKCVTLSKNKTPSFRKLRAFSDDHDPENDFRVYSILLNEKPYYFLIGMKMARTDYAGLSCKDFNKTINDFDFCYDICFK